MSCFKFAIPCAAVFVTISALGADVKTTQMQQFIDQLQENVRQSPREGFDADAVVEKVGRDPVKLYAWVKEQTHYVPYQGALRGPMGVLMDRVGNDLDRSLLMVQLLAACGYEARLAHVQVDEATAKKILQSAQSTPLPQGPTPAANSFVANVDAWATKNADAWLKLLPKATQADSVAAEQLAAAKDHWWVQYQPADAWVDLDLDAAKTGEALASGDVQNIDCPSKDIAANIPREQKHIVTLRVIVERWQDNKLNEDTALEWPVTTSNWPDIHVSLTHRVEAGTKLAAGDDANAVKKKLLTHKKWRPILILDGHARGPKTFDESGALADADSGAGQVGNASRGMFGGLSGAASGHGDAPTSVLTAEFLDFVIESPGHEKKTIRCEVFDSMGPAARAAASMDRPKLDDNQRLERAAALSGQCDNLISSCGFSQDFFRNQVNTHAIRSKDKLLKAAATADSPAQHKAVLAAIIPDPLELYAYIRGFSIGSPDSTFIDGPNIARLVLQRRLQADGNLHETALCDLACNHTASISANPSEAFAANFRRGLIDSALELAAACNFNGKVDDAAAPNNTRILFDRAAGKSIAPAVVASADNLTTPSADVKQREINEIGGGNVLISLTSHLDNRTGWWRIDPTTGQTVGMMDNGYHAAMTEEVEITQEITLTEEFLEDEILTDEEILKEQEAKDFFNSFEKNLDDQKREDIFWVLDAAFDCW